MATVSNQTKNTATPTNQAFGSQSLIWMKALFAWINAAGTWMNPYSMSNSTKNTASMSNQAKN